MGLFWRRKKNRPKPPPRPTLQQARDLRASGARRAAQGPANEPHILQAFDERLRDLAAKAAAMGVEVAGMVRRSGPAFADRDLAAAKDIIAADAVVDRQKDAVRAATVEALARHAPVASDLRLILAVEHIAGNLERAADHAKNIAKRTLSLTSAHRLDPATRDLMARLHRAVTAMFEDSLKAFERGDAELAAQVRGRDSEPDALYDDLFHAAIAKLQTGKSDPAVDVQVLFVGKSLERIGDHATNIAEEVRFFARGDIAPATRPS